MHCGTKMSKSKPNNKQLGRPKAYDPEQALMKALETFWKYGFSNTSMDDLSQSMGMNRPSIYAAFGDKRSLYLKAVAYYRDFAKTSIRKKLFGAHHLKDALCIVFHRALEVYIPAASEARGCFLISTAPVEAANDPKIRKELAKILGELDHIFRERFELAVKKKELGKKYAPAILAQLATSVLYSLSIRSRSGAKQQELETMIAAAVNFLCCT